MGENVPAIAMMSAVIVWAVERDLACYNNTAQIDYLLEKRKYEICICLCGPKWYFFAEFD